MCNKTVTKLAKNEDALRKWLTETFPGYHYQILFSKQSTLARGMKNYKVELLPVKQNSLESFAGGE